MTPVCPSAIVLLRRMAQRPGVSTWDLRLKTSHRQLRRWCCALAAVGFIEPGSGRGAWVRPKVTPIGMAVARAHAVRMPQLCPALQRGLTERVWGALVAVDAQPGVPVRENVAIGIYCDVGQRVRLVKRAWAHGLVDIDRRHPMTAAPSDVGRQCLDWWANQHSEQAAAK